MISKKLLISGLIGSVTTLILAGLIQYDVLGRSTQIDWYFSCESETTVTQIQVFPQGEGVVNPEAQSKTVSFGNNRHAKFRVEDYPSSRIKVNFSGLDQSWILNRIVLHSGFAPAVTLQGAEILNHFRPLTSDTTLQLDRGSVVLKTTGDTGSLYGPTGFVFSNPFIAYLLPLLVGIVTFAVLMRWDISEIPSVRLAGNRNNSSIAYSSELDGLRGIAAISVVADHTWGYFSGMGVVGVWIFFALSGYLLSIPFVRQPDRIFSPMYVRDFYLRRIARIVPMYYFTLFLYYVASGHQHIWVPHLLFLQGNGHLWTIPQEMLFYLVLPLVLMAMSYMIGKGIWIALIVLFLVTTILIVNLDLIPMEIYSGNTRRPAYIGWFLGGVGVAYILNRSDLSALLDRTPESIRIIIGYLAIALLLCAFLAGTNHNSLAWFDSRFSLAVQAANWYAPIAAFLVFAAVFSRNSLYGRILRNPVLRSYGILGFSVYLIHPMLMEGISRYKVMLFGGDNVIGPVLFIATMVVTWVVSSISFNLIEYPFISRAAKKPSN